MKIIRISVFRLALPLQRPYELQGGRLRFEQLDSTLVRLDTDDGVSGWGEACPWRSTYLPAFPKGIRAGLEELAPGLLGRDPRRTDVINTMMDTALPGHPYVKSAIDIACWDILGKATGLPVCDLLGGRRPEDVTIQSSIPSDDPPEMWRTIERYHARGYRIHSAKVGSDVAADIERIEYLAERMPAGSSLTIDANRAWIPDQAIRVMQATETVDAYFEQPCETYEECLQVRRSTRQPILLDEIIHTYEDLVRAYHDQACEGIGLKPNRVGGLTKARRIRDFCVQMGLRLNIEDTGGTALADTAAVHLAQATPARYRRGTWFCHEMITVDPIIGGARNLGGVARAPRTPGLGAEPDPEALGDPLMVVGYE
ncbi:MAG: mandelate racemase [Acidimicrobiia bacterium]|nr:mandelate racemase [Acidimicrobiia bacterium]